MSEKRKHVRTTVSAAVELMHPSFGSLSVKTRDMSNGGVFLFTGNRIELPVGTEVSVQAQEMMVEAPIVKAKIIRVEADGVALEFIRDD